MQLFKITVGTHFFKVQPRAGDARALELCYAFTRKFIKVDFQGNTKTVTTFAAADKHRTWFRFHFNALKDFSTFLFFSNVDKSMVETIYLDEPDVPEVDLHVRPGWVPTEEQVPAVDYLSEPVGKYDHGSGQWVGGGPRARFLGLTMGKGKLVRNGTMVKVPFGWKPIDKLNLGDLVLSVTGEYAPVLGVYPEKNVQMYKVLCEDGRSLHVHREHLWEYARIKHTRKRVLVGNTAEMIENLASGCRVYLPLGDSAKECHDIISAKEAIVLGRDLQNGIVKDRELLVRCLHGKTWVRKCLLAGVLENYTTVHKTKIEHLMYKDSDAILDVQYLVRSLGGICTIVEDNCSDYSMLVIKHKRLREMYISASSRGCTDNDALMLEVVSIEPDGISDATCIKIDHPRHLFVCQDFVVTHNTFCSVKSVCNLKMKVVVIVLSRFSEKWIADLVKIMDITPKEILSVSSGADMRALTEMAITPGSMDPYKAIVISSRNYETYLKTYEMYNSDLESFGYLVPPDDLWVKLGIGIRLIDEVHMAFHANFRMDLYTHIKQTISLSGTLISDDPTMIKMYKIAYPPGQRYGAVGVEKYTDSYGIHYRINPKWHVKINNRGTTSYSHTAFESSILKNNALLNAYTTMVGDYVQKGFINHYKPGNKSIIFCATVDLCGKMAEKLQERFPDKTVKRYVAEDPYKENYLDPDIRVTTLGSGGTAHDVPGLTDNHLTVAIDSVQSNLQAFGRTRKIPDQQTRFYFYSCEHIKKHMGYHAKKVILMKEHAKSYTPLFYDTLGDRHLTMF